MADARDLKSLGLLVRAGSTPALGTHFLADSCPTKERSHFLMARFFSLGWFNCLIFILKLLGRLAQVARVLA